MDDEEGFGSDEDDWSTVNEKLKGYITPSRARTKGLSHDRLSEWICLIYLPFVFLLPHHIQIPVELSLMHIHVTSNSFPEIWGQSPFKYSKSVQNYRIYIF